MNSQLNLSDRIAIEAGIAAGKSFKEIATMIHRNPVFNCKSKCKSYLALEFSDPFLW